MNRLKVFPDWMRQELVNLDYSSSFVDAQDRGETILRDNPRNDATLKLFFRTKDYLIPVAMLWD